MVTLYKIVKYITFPGALLKGFLEHLFCRLFGIPVENTEYMQSNELCGHVEHELAGQKGSFAICGLPHILMLILGFGTALPGAISLLYLGTISVLPIILLYVGVSFLANACPLEEDVLNMWENLYGKDSSSKTVSKIFLAIPAAAMYVGAYLEKWGFSLLSGFLCAWALPYVIQLFTPLGL